MRKIIAILLAFILTGVLVLFCVSLIGRQIILPAMNEKGAKVSDAIIREEQELARQRVKEAADLFGFDAEPVIALISEDTLRELNAQASAWWSSILQEGITGSEISWDTAEIQKVILSDARISSMEDRDEAEILAAEAAENVRRSIVRIVLPMRQQTMGLGIQEAAKRIDIQNVVSFFLGLPWAALALCAVLAGLIALFGSRTVRESLRYTGSAMGAAALVILILAALYMSAGVLPMIREASAALAVQFRSLVSGAMIRTVILAAVLAAGCILCLIGSRKAGKKA